ncbi:MAG: TolC family protein [Deltaproteobacteria bacterium]|nr:TolC family protein [Deltaproteobacteria bacterium]
MKLSSRQSIVFLYFLVFILWTSGVSALDNGRELRLNLEECIARAIRNNEEIKMAHYDVYASIAKKIEATKRYVPVVNYKYRFAPVPKDLDNPSAAFFSGDLSILNSIKIEVGIPLTTFGRITVNQELADIGIDASKLQKVRKADEIILDIYKLYNGILLARELTQLATKGLEAVSNKIAELEKEETVDQLEILKLKAILYQIEKKMDEAHKKETIALAMLKFRIGAEDDVRLLLKDTYLVRESFTHRSFEEFLGISKDRRPEFKLLAHKVAAEEKKLVLKKKEYFPKLIAGGFFEYGVSPGIQGDENDNTFNNPFNYTKAGVGLELNGELDFRKLRANVKEQEALYFKTIAEKRSNFRLLEIDLKDAYLEYVQRRDLLLRADKEQRAARQIVFLTKSNLDIGVGEKKDYLDALQSYLLIQAAVFENMFQYNVAVATLRSKMGMFIKPESVVDMYKNMGK